MPCNSGQDLDSAQWDLCESEAGGSKAQLGRSINFGASAVLDTPSGGRPQLPDRASSATQGIDPLTQAARDNLISVLPQRHHSDLVSDSRFLASPAGFPRPGSSTKLTTRLPHDSVKHPGCKIARLRSHFNLRAANSARVLRWIECCIMPLGKYTPPAEGIHVTVENGSLLIENIGLEINTTPRPFTSPPVFDAGAYLDWLINEIAGIAEDDLIYDMNAFLGVAPVNFPPIHRPLTPDTPGRGPIGRTFPGSSPPPASAQSSVTATYRPRAACTPPPEAT
ncbi:Uu.00g146310.m01.CDS01 [Anthostomella pinea]|uniref:Uu.00g146310.m01.CDS01 n=1 Tax=Anthostomella pinea TaxID=933095 RepID=A0AAI8YM27_9PEZI|nr:Uu.00g146310.m01.CDS01 [Anthostomella pinea]